jgi:hypothetical protein
MHCMARVFPRSHIGMEKVDGCSDLYLTISCLDDAELEFLGVPWPEYEECARNNEMDVLRSV